MSKLLAGKYETLSLAGEGGMAKVYRGLTHGAAGFTRPVAIKRVIEPLTSDPNFVKMFVEEARVVSQLQHPNIVQIHDFDRDSSGLYFLVMEWVEGVTLYDWQAAYGTAGQRTPWPLTAAIGIEVLRALSAAHERKKVSGESAPIFHRDITPHNVMVSSIGVVKLTDFGLARAMDRAKVTHPDVVKGKLSYLSPELTKLQEPTQQTDLFGVGITLWETLTGTKLFDGEKPMEVILAVQEAKVPALSDFRDDVPARLEEIIRQALSKEPDDRFVSAAVMAQELATFLRGTHEKTGETALAKSVEWVRKEREANWSDPADQTLVDPSIPLLRKK